MERKTSFIALITLVMLFGLINNTYSQADTVSNKQLLEMNRVYMPSFEDYCNEKEACPFKILIVGNSITKHGISEKIGWGRSCGMAASRIDNDYVHILFRQIETLLPKRRICMRVSNLADFERNFTSYDFKSVNGLNTFNADIIVFQLGENVSFDSTKTPLLFKRKYIDLIKYIKNGQNPFVICTTPFFPSNVKNEIIEDVAIRLEVQLLICLI